MKHLFKMMSLIAAVIFGSMVMYSCTIEDEDNEIGGDDGGDTPSQIQGPKWVLVDVWAPDITEEDVREHNIGTVYKIDSVKVVATKTSFSGYLGKTVHSPGTYWDGGYYLYCFEITKIPQEIEGGGKIALYNKVTLPKHYRANYEDNDHIQWHYYHCSHSIISQIRNKILCVAEEDKDKCGGRDQPIVMMENNEPDIYESEAWIYADMPKGRSAGDRIELSFWEYTDGSIYDKYIKATYTYEWRE